MSEEPIVPIPTEEPRHCPVCGARVAALATTCLMCGASLTEEEEVEEEVVRHRPHWVWWVIAGLIFLLVLVAASTLLRPLLLPASPTPTHTAAPTRTPTPTSTGTPTPTPTITPTPTPVPPRAHQVQGGETVASIAELYDTTVEEILALNPGIEPELLQVGQVLLVPPALPTPGLAATETPEEPTPGPGGVIVHVVAPGETLLSIAERYSVTVAVIRAANPAIPPGSDVIQVNQALLIPVGTPAPSPTPTLNPDATPTPLPTYRAPTLLSPPDGAVFGGPDAVIVLQWASVGILRVGEWYEIHLARPGAEPVVERTRATAYRVPSELYPPPGSTLREFRWHVRVVRRLRRTEDVYEQASLPGPVRVFTWLEEVPTPTPTPTPSPSPTP